MFFISPMLGEANTNSKNLQQKSYLDDYVADFLDNAKGKDVLNNQLTLISLEEALSGSSKPTREEVLKNRYGETAIDQYHAYYDELKKAKTIVIFGVDHASDANPAIQIKFGRCTGTYGLDSIYYCLDKGTVEFKHDDGTFTIEDLEDIGTDSFTIEVDGKSIPIDKVAGKDIAWLLVAVANGKDISEYFAINGISLADFVSAGKNIGKDMLKHNLGTIVEKPGYSEIHIPNVSTHLNFK